MVSLEILWLLFSYGLGSLPFGFLITRWSAKKNIIKIGWRKTSGSNVFKNVGKWQGALTGLLDLSKGGLAVWGAKKLGLGQEFQVAAGALSVVGHNWSCWLKFKGGRGIATFIGAALVLSPKIIGLSLLPFLFLTLIWNGAVGTLLLLATLTFLGFAPGTSAKTAGLFGLVNLPVILIKRLSPMRELGKTESRATLIKNRLFFDSDEPQFGLRIQKIPAKDKNLSPEQVTQVTSLGVEELKNWMTGATEMIIKHQEEINRINVFPVADKDTGYNLAATLLGIEGAISVGPYRSILELAKDIKTAVLANARGNVGMIYAGYLMKLLEKIEKLPRVDSLQLARAMKKAARAAEHSIEKPVEGTILDVMKASGNKAYEVIKVNKERDIVKMLEASQAASQTALALTKEKLAVLKQNNVVDAGALGFVKILEAWLEALKNPARSDNKTLPRLLGTELHGFNPCNIARVEPVQFSPCPLNENGSIELICRFKMTELKKNNSWETTKGVLTSMGASFNFLEANGEIKLHIHTACPEKIKEKLKDFELLEWQEEKITLPPSKTQKGALGLVVGESADLPGDFLNKHQIEEVPFKVMFPDNEVLTRDNLFPKIREAARMKRPLPTTSTPSFGDFLQAYQQALKNFEKVLCITLSSKLSGTYSSARVARSLLNENENEKITVLDCLTGEVGEALVAMKAQELIDEGRNKKQVLECLKEFCPKVKLVAGVENFKYAVRSGRIKIPSFLIAPIFLLQKLGLQFLISLRQGQVRFLGLRMGRDLAKILAKEILNQAKGQTIRTAIAHADNLKTAQRLKEILEKNGRVKVLFSSSISPVIGIYAGPGALLAAFAPVDDI